MVRVHWRKDVGFRLYKYTHNQPLNSPDTLNYQVLTDLYDKKISQLTERQADKQLEKVRSKNHETLSKSFQEIL